MLYLKFSPKRHLTSQLGQGLVEYALILVLISVAAIIIMGLFGSEVAAVYNEVTTALANS